MTATMIPTSTGTCSCSKGVLCGPCKADLDHLTPTRPRDLCSKCHGSGEIVERHPSFGSRSCPSPTIESVCNMCGGSGLGWAGAK